MSVIASCGHKLKDEENMGNTIYVKDFDRYGKKVICYTTLCNNCLSIYREKGLELKSEQEKNNWIGFKQI